MEKVISTIVISENQNTQELLKLYISENTNYKFLSVASDYSKAYLAVKELERCLVVVDLSEFPDPGLNFIAKITQEFPNARVIALSDRLNVDLMVKALRSGANEIASLPLIKNVFSEALDKIYLDLAGLEKKKNKSRTITIFSNKGGIGKTSIATNLALELAKITKENVALIDLNFQLGDITTFLDLKPSFNISYMLQNLDKINEDYLLSTMEKYEDTSLYVLADPPFFKHIEKISANQVSKLFDILKETFSYVVVDASAGFGTETITALSNSDMVLLTTIVNLPALRNCQRCLDLLEKLGIGQEKIQIILNRHMENDEIKLEDVEEVLGRKVFWKIPNNYFTMMASINKGVPVCDINSNSNVAKSYKELALLVCDNIYKHKTSSSFSKIVTDNINNS